MAKAGTGKGNAFASPGPSYAYMELSRRNAQLRADVADRHAFLSVAIREKEDELYTLSSELDDAKAEPVSKSWY